MESPPKPAAVAGALAVCTAGGALCAWAGTPLPWMIGSITGMAVARMAGLDIAGPRVGREAGMLVIGITLGLYFTAPVVREVAAYWPWFVFLGFASIALGAASALVLVRFGGVDRATAFFGSMPGGAAEMAHLGERHGAAMEYVAFAHSMRMLVVVIGFPFGITWAGFSATEDYRPVAMPFDAAGLAVLAGVGLAAGLAARRARVPTAFIMGPLAVVAALTVAGVTLSSMPVVLTNAAQVVIGASLGSRFDRRFLVAAPRFVAALLPSVALMVALAIGVGWAIAASSDTYLGTALLAAAPGGIAEMAITAQVLRIGVAFVTAAHVVRFVIVVLLAVPMFRLLEGARGRVLARRQRP